MKKASIYLIIEFSLILLVSCTSDERIEPEGAVPEVVSFEQDIIPIFQARCAFTGCHVETHPTLDLQASVAFEELFNTNEIDLDNPTNSKIYRRITGETPPQMPLGMEPLNESQMETILRWIEQGAPNN